MRYPARGWRRVAWRESRHIRGSLQALLLTLILPLVTASLMAWIFGASVPRALPVAVVDQDHSSFSRQATRMLSSSPGVRVVFQETSAEAALRRMRRGEIYAFVLFPRDLYREVVGGKSPVIGVYVNGQALLPASLVSRDLRQALGTLTAGVKLRVRLKTGETRSQALARIDPVRLESHALFIPELDYRRFLVPALVAALLQILVLFAAIRALGREIKRRSAGRWFRHAGGNAPAALWGKLSPYLAIHSLVTLLLLSLWHGPMGNPVAGSFLAEWAALILMGAAAQAIAIFMVGWSADYRLSLSMGAFFAGPSMAFAGVTFPTAAMNGTAYGWANMLPLTHAIQVVVDQGVRGSSLHADLGPFAALVGLMAFFLLLSLRRWRRVLVDRSLWGAS